VCGDDACGVAGPWCATMDIAAKAWNDKMQERIDEKGREAP
jgi:hypothetical protein